MYCVNSVYDRGAIMEVRGPGYVMTIEQEKDKSLLRKWIKEGKRFAEMFGEETMQGVANYIEYMMNNSDDWDN